MTSPARPFPDPTPTIPTVTGDTTPGDTAASSVMNTGNVADHNHTLSMALIALQQQACYPDLPAGGVDYHAAFPAGAPVDSLGPFATFAPGRTVRISGSAGTVASVWVVNGQAFNGVSLAEVISHPGGAVDVDGEVAFAKVDHVTSDVDPQDNTTVQTGNGFSVGFLSFFQSLGVDGAEESPLSVDAPSGGITPTTPPDGAHDYFVRFYAYYAPSGTANPGGAHVHAQTQHTHPSTSHHHSI